MGLDVELLHFDWSPKQISLLRSFVTESAAIRQAMFDGKPCYRVTYEEYLSYIETTRRLRDEKYFDLIEHDAEKRVKPEVVNQPSSLNPYKNLGCWRVGYGSSWKPEENFALGVLYEALPEAHPNLAMEVWSDWAYARKVINENIEALQITNAYEYKYVSALNVFLETINYVLSQPNPNECYCLDWSP